MRFFSQYQVNSSKNSNILSQETQKQQTCDSKDLVHMKYKVVLAS